MDDQPNATPNHSLNSLESSNLRTTAATSDATEIPQHVLLDWRLVLGYLAVAIAALSLL